MERLLPRITTLLKLTIVVGITSVIFLNFTSKQNTPAQASSTECPAWMSDSQCLEHLRKVAQDLQQEERVVSQQLSEEEYNKLDIFAQISYFNNQIVQTQQEIEELEVEMQTTLVEIRILKSEIADIQTKISTIMQEISATESSIKKRIILSYRYTTYTPIEVLLASTEIDGLLRQIRYLKDTRKKDQELLTTMVEQKDLLSTEVELLDSKKGEVEKKQSELESQKTEVFEQKELLSEQKATQQSLYAQSEQKIAQYSAVLDANRLTQSSLDEQISQLLAKLTANVDFSQGAYIPAGTVIGYMGQTGCATGAHLHFSINSGKKYPGWGHFWGDVNPWSGYLTLSSSYWYKIPGWTYYFVDGNAMLLPLQGNAVLTQNHHQGMAIDLWSLHGEGAPIYAAMEGRVITGVESQCGGKYAMIEHPNGLVTIYLHMK